MVTRALDLAVLFLLAVAILLPRPDVKATPALAVDAATRDRVAELQTRLLRDPGDTAAALELADVFMDARHPDWALAAVSGPLAAHPDDHRLHQRRSLALADHYEAAPAYLSAQRALALCLSGSSAPCGEGERARLELLESTLRRVRYIDMRKDPNSAKEEILKGLRPTYIPPRKQPAPKK